MAPRAHKSTIKVCWQLTFKRNENIMPKRPEVLIHKSRMQEEDMRVALEKQFLEPAVPRPSKNTRIFRLVEQIYQHFEPLINKPDLSLTHPITYLPASLFEYLEDKNSRPTIIKAKKILGIRSVKHKDEWVWTLPRFAPTESMQRLHVKRIAALTPLAEQLYEMNRPGAKRLTDIMTAHNYDAIGDDVCKEMLAYGYKRSTAVRLKGKLGIVSIKRDEHWHWVWAPRIVQDWLEVQLSTGPVALTVLYERAYSEHMWTADVVRMARIALGGVHSKLISQVVCWVSIN